MPRFMQKLFTLVALLLAAPLWAQSFAQLPHTRVDLISEVVAPRPGASFTVGLVMEPKPGWHTYWKNPGDAGMPPTLSWTLPAGVQAGALRFPVPEPFVVAGIMNHVFSHRNILLADVALPAGFTGALPLVAKVDWLVCDDRLCVPESATLRLDLAAGDGAPDPLRTADFDAARAALPRQLAGKAGFAVRDGRILLSVPFATAGTVTGAHFFSAGDDDFVFASPQTITRTADALIIEAAAVGPPPASIAGVLRVEQGGDMMGLALTAAPGVVAPGQPLVAAAGGPRASAVFLPALGLAVLGGVLLNLMPCVFPILSLKAMSLARAGETPAAARTEGLAYTAGVVLVTTLLGLAVILISRAGAGAGWAFQLQEPRVILLLLLLTFAIALNFAGLFAVNAGTLQAGHGLASQPGARGAFFTGALAAFVATPCTGPFMAGALGAALVLPPLAGLLVFVGLGFGLALPFLAIGFVPALRKRLPRPGAWMLTFRRILAIPMLLTSLALAWVLGRQAGVPGLMLGLLAAMMMALGLWWLGLRQARGARAVPALVLVALAVLAAPLALARLPAPAAGMANPAPDGLAAVPWTPEKLAAAQAAGQPLLLYFTADWCLTCKVNERGALASDAVADHFRQQGIQVMVGDWTKPDAAIARFLEQRGRAGIPLYLFYAADGSITELPQLLTVNMLTALASKGSAKAD